MVGATPTTEESARLALVPERLATLAATYGRSGVQHSGGKVVRDWDTLTYRERAYELDLMRLDPQVQLALATRTVPALGAIYEVKCPTNDPRSEMLAELLRQVFGLEGRPGLMRRTFAATQAEAAWAIHYGSFVQEVLWHYVTLNGKVWAIPYDLEARIPSSIDRWGEDDQLGPITQIVRGSGRRPEPMPGDKVLVYTRRQQGTDWTGEGLGRAAWSGWRRLRQLVDMRQIGAGRLGVLPPVVSYDREAARASGVEESSIDTTVLAVRDALLQLQSGQRGTLAVPSWVTINWGTADNFDPAKLITAESSEIDNIHAAYGTGHLRMGLAGNTGNRSLGEVSTDTMRRAAVEDVDVLLAPINGIWRAGGGLVGAIAELNMPDIPPHLYPTIVATGLEPDAMAEALGMLGALAPVWLTPDDAGENRIRDVLGMPPLAEGEGRTPDERMAAAAGGPAMGLLSRIRNTTGARADG